VPAQQPPANPPSRRRPVPQQTPPARRPRVAGLRRPEGPSSRPEPGTPETAADAEATQVIPAVPAEPEPDAPRLPPPPIAAGPPGAAEPAAERRRPPARRRPRPAPEPEPAPEPLAEDDADETARRSRWRVPVVLAVVAVLIGGLAAWFGVEWSHVRHSASNTALTDSATTSQISGQVTSAVNTIFSYDYTNMQKTEQAVPRLLTGNALCQYNLLFKVVQQQAPAEKLVLTTTVQAKGVQLLQGDTARVLVQVDQHDTRASTNQTSDAQSVFAVNAVRQGGVWKISAIDTLNGANPNTSCKS
jgi:Mce-associated membrane protein